MEDDDKVAINTNSGFEGVRRIKVVLKKILVFKKHNIPRGTDAMNVGIIAKEPFPEGCIS